MKTRLAGVVIRVELREKSLPLGWHDRVWDGASDLFGEWMYLDDLNYDAIEREVHFVLRALLPTTDVLGRWEAAAAICMAAVEGVV